jgi:hypothetical protein
MRERRADLETSPGAVDEILAAGAETLRPIARETMGEVREHLGIPGSMRYPGGGKR